MHNELADRRPLFGDVCRPIIPQGRPQRNGAIEHILNAYAPAVRS